MNDGSDTALANRHEIKEFAIDRIADEQVARMNGVFVVHGYAPAKKIGTGEGCVGKCDVL